MEAFRKRCRKKLKLANATLKYTKDGLEKMDLTFLVSSSIQEQWLLENFKKETEEISLSFKKADEIIKGLLEAIDGNISINPIEFDLPDIQGLVSKIVEKRDGLNQDSVNKRISECEKIEQEYTDKSKVIDLIPTITSYVEYLKWDSIAEKSKTKTRAITTKQKELFEKYVTDDYLQAFEDECRKLNANFNVEIVSRGSSGQTLKKLQIRGTTPAKVLSEGEQRAISIANFLTEVRMDSRNAGIVLDDPVCSLDHKRRSLIVNLYSELEAGMTECSSWCHDQARAINGDIPTAEDLKKYIECFEKYWKQYKAK